MARFIGVAIGFGLVVLLQCAAAQTVHVVGDTMGWTIPSNGPTAYTNWARGKNFAVGDILLFNFNTNAHDVLRVTKASYDACNNANPIGDVITTGPVNITLDAAGEHYYICTFSQHCQIGQKLAITVSSSPGTPGSSPTTPTTPTPTPTPTTPSPLSNGPAADCPTSDPPTTGGPGTQNTTPGAISPTSSPGSSSSKLLAGVSVSVMAVVLGLLF